MIQLSGIPKRLILPISRSTCQYFEINTALLVMLIYIPPVINHISEVEGPSSLRFEVR